MLILKEPEMFAVNEQQEYVLEAHQTWGERVVLRQRWIEEERVAGLAKYCPQGHSGATTDERDRIRAAYGGSTGDSFCPLCYGVGLVAADDSSGGFKEPGMVVWALFGDQTSFQERSRSGEMFLAKPQVQFPWTPLVRHRDLVIRVEQWSGNLVVREFARYQCGTVQPHTLKTGPGPNDPVIYLAQTTVLDNVPPDHPLYQVPPQGIVGTIEGSSQAPYATLGLLLRVEVPVGVVDGANTQFFTTDPFLPGTVELFLNGLLQRAGVDYAEVAPNQVVFTQAPRPPWDVRVQYLVEVT